MTASTARAWLCAGDTYLARFVNGAPGPKQGPFEAEKFAITPKSTVKNQTSKGRYTYGQAIESVVIPDVPTLDLTLTEVNKVTLAIALLGDGVVNSQASGALADAPVTAELDAWVDLGKQNLGDLTVKNAAGSTTYVLGTDYLVNPNLGWIKALSTGAITTAEALKVSGPYTSFDETVISGMADTQLRLRVWFDGVNLVDNSPVIGECYEVVLAAKDALDFLKSDFNAVNLTGSLKTPAGFTSPYLVRLRDPS